MLEPRHASFHLRNDLKFDQCEVVEVLGEDVEESVKCS